MPMVGVDTAATELDHAAAQAARSREVKFEVGVKAPHPGCLLRREHTVGPDDRAAFAIAHQQVFAVIVKQVDVMARQRARQPRAHLAGKNLMAQTLRLPHLVLMARPADHNAAAVPTSALIGVISAAMKSPPGQLYQGQGLGWAGQFFHGAFVFNH
jgi:hypothetical protein